MGWNESSKSDFSWGSYKVRGFSAPNLITYMESHDEERVLYSNMTWGNNSNPLYPINSNLETSLKRAELCAVFFLTIPGPKMIWQFGELGYDYSINYNGRLGNKPIKWDYYLNPNRYRLFSVYKELNYLKNYYPAFTSTNFSLSTSALVKTISINHETMNIVIVGNFDIYPQSADITFSNDGWWYDYFSNDSIYVSDNKYSIRLNISEYKLFTSKKIQKHHIINAPEARNVKIFGKAGTGNILSVTYNYYDIEDDPEGSTVINWYRSNNASGLNKVKISTKSSSEYQLSYADSGYYIIAEVIPYAKTGILLKGLPEYDIISFSTLIKNTNNESLSLFPNPANEFIILSFNEPAMKEVKVRIMDIYGQIVKEFKISKGTRSKTLFVNDLKSGIYIVSTNSSQTIKFVKE